MKKTCTAPALQVCGSLEELTQGLGNGGAFPRKGNTFGHKNNPVLTFS